MALAQSHLRFTAAILLFTALVPLAHAQDCSDLQTGPPPFKWANVQPLILLTEYNPWASVIGSDTPTFALYADGTVIYWQGDRSTGKYLTSHLSQDEIHLLLNTTHLDNPAQFKDCYSISDVTDQPTNVLIVSHEASFKSITVYGTIRYGMPEQSSSIIPTALQSALASLLNFHTQAARPWQPLYFEVVVWPFEYAKSSRAWPKDLPAFDAKYAVKTKSGYHLFIPIARLHEYESFQSKLKPTQAGLIGGRKWATSARLPFPHEGVPWKSSNAPSSNMP